MFGRNQELGSRPAMPGPSAWQDSLINESWLLQFMPGEINRPVTLTLKLRGRGANGPTFRNFGYGSLMFHSEILASLNFNKNEILSPGLENNHTLKCCSCNFPT